MEKSDNAQGKPSAVEKNREPLAKDDTSALRKDEDEPDAYRCLIIKEHPLAPNEN